MSRDSRADDALLGDEGRPLGLAGRSLPYGSRVDPERRRLTRLARAWMASAATGCAIYLLVVHVALPALRVRLTPAQVEWLRQAFDRHPVVVLGVLLAVAAVLGLPVLGAFRWAYGPLRVGRDSTPPGRP